VALPAAAAKPVKLVRGKQAVDFVTGAPVTCIPIQGGGQSFVGAEPLVEPVR
jgi:hypothetical protein